VSCGRGVAAGVLAILDGHHALYKVGRRLDERGRLPLLQPGLEVMAVHDTRLGHILDALFAANLNQVFGAIALKVLETYAIAPGPWRSASRHGRSEGGAGRENPSLRLEPGPSAPSAHEMRPKAGAGRAGTRGPMAGLARR
jgi:hypothetical protein